MQASVIIPMYNEERYIARCLDSLKNQTFKDFEIILVDDGSKDRTIEEAKYFQAFFSLTIINQEHGGPGKARNLGAGLAKGEYLIFVDADMFFDKKYIEELLSPLIAGKEIGTSHGTELVGNLENPIARAWGVIRGKYNPAIPRTIIYRAIKRDIFLKSGGFDSSKGYFDDDLSKINNGLGALFIENAICYHNNPEKLQEAFKHSIWVGKGLMESGQIKEYAIKYKGWIACFVALLSIGTVLALSEGLFLLLPTVLLGVILFLIYIKTIQRTLKEKYVSHLVFIPLVMSIRGLGYCVGILKYFLK